MKTLHNWLYRTVLFTFSSFASAYEPMLLGVPQLKPFTYYENTQFKGNALKPVENALQKANIPYQFVFVPNYSLLLKALRNKEIDGFFLATKNVERDRYAQFSKPILIDRYSWFVLNSSSADIESDVFKLNSKVGAVQNTNSFRLLTRLGFQVYGQPSPLLAKNFVGKNVDAVFATYSPFRYQLDALSFPKNKYRVIHHSKRPFGIYISKHYIHKFPDVMQKVDHFIQTEENH